MEAWQANARHAMPKTQGDRAVRRVRARHTIRCGGHSAGCTSAGDGEFRRRPARIIRSIHRCVITNTRVAVPRVRRGRIETGIRKGRRVAGSIFRRQAATSVREAAPTERSIRRMRRPARKWVSRTSAADHTPRVSTSDVLPFPHAVSPPPIAMANLLRPDRQGPLAPRCFLAAPPTRWRRSHAPRFP